MSCFTVFRGQFHEIFREIDFTKKTYHFFLQIRLCTLHTWQENDAVEMIVAKILAINKVAAI